MKNTLQRALLALVVISGASLPLCAMEEGNKGGYVPYESSGLSLKALAALGIAGSSAYLLYTNDEYSKQVRGCYADAKTGLKRISIRILDTL